MCVALLAKLLLVSIAPARIFYFVGAQAAMAARISSQYVAKACIEGKSKLAPLSRKASSGSGPVLTAMVKHRLSLNELADAVKLFPQVLINVRFAGGNNPLESDAVKAVAAEVEKRLAGKGRILLRKSGTEPLIRVMVECEDGALAQQCAEEIAEAVKAN